MDRFQNWMNFPCIHHMSSSFKVRSSTYLKLKLKSATPQSPQPRLATDLFMLRAWKCWGTLQLIAGHQHSPLYPSCQHRSAVLQCTYLACFQHHPCSVTAYCWHYPPELDPAPRTSLQLSPFPPSLYPWSRQWWKPVLSSENSCLSCYCMIHWRIIKAVGGVLVWTIREMKV